MSSKHPIVIQPRSVLEIQSWISDRIMFVLLQYRSAHKTLYGKLELCSVHDVEEFLSTYEEACWHVVRSEGNYFIFKYTPKKQVRVT